MPLKARYNKDIFSERGMWIMKTTVSWNESLYMLFINKMMLSRLEREVLRCRIMEYTVTEISEELGVSKSTVDRTVKKLRLKYDKLREMDSTLPPRRMSDKEKWMDEN